VCHSWAVNILLRAIITGFGLRIGSELGKYVSKHIFPKDAEPETQDSAEEDDSLGSITPDPPEV